MNQLFQDLRTGKVSFENIPVGKPAKGYLLTRSLSSLISAGTERMLIDFGKASMLQKAKQQPDKVRMVLEKVKTDGLLPTLDAVRSKLEEPLAMGYCNVGIVEELGPGFGGTGIKKGVRVASNAKHAEIGLVPFNLCAIVPDNVSNEAASFTVLGAIALQGIRLIQPTLGETVVVTGLGLVGLMTVQLLKAQGCRVLGIDFDSGKCTLARQFGAETVDLSMGENPLEVANAFSRGRGVDAVLITAATKSNEPVHQAAVMCRKRGRIVLVGVAGLELSRADFFEKELTFQVSCSYGPGRYDSNYEEKGHDYPVGYVRWTEQRNFEAVLDMLADGRLDVDPLISHRFDLEQAEEAYNVLAEDRRALGIVLRYPSPAAPLGSDLFSDTVILREVPPAAQQPIFGVIGAGNYGSRVLIPAFKSAGAVLKTVASSGGVSAVHVGKKLGFDEATTNTDGLFADTNINAVIITTRHNSHANFVCQGLRSGKHVFVEKPLCLTNDEMKEIEDAYVQTNMAHASRPLVMVGFNRRFAPQIIKIKELLSSVKTPKSFIMTINAGMIPEDHWTQDVTVGGGRLIGEGCHFIDLLRFLADSEITDSHVSRLQGGSGDTFSVQLSFGNGSIGSIHYFANGSKSVPKERLDIYAAGRILQLDNFRTLRGYGWQGFSRMNLWRQDKGQQGCAAAFLKAIKEGTESPIPFSELVEVSKVSIRLAEEIRHG